MAVFDQRAELSRQKRHITAKWDDDKFNKFLGFNEKGGRNAWGKAIGMIPGVNAGTHAIAKARAHGTTKDVLNETFDEAVNKDFAGAAFGVNIAKTVMGGGIGGGAGAGGGGGFGSGIKNVLGKGGDMPVNVTGTALENAGPEADKGGMFSNIGGKIRGAFGGGDGEEPTSDARGPLGGNLAGITDAFKSQTDKISSENLKNPHEPGTPEHDAFENQMKEQQKQNNKGAFGEGMKGLLKSSTSGNIFESGANWAGSIVASEMEEKNAIRDAEKGNFAYNPSLNYL